MQQRSFGKQIWRIFGPLIVKGGIALLIQTIVMSIYLMPHMAELTENVRSQSEYYERVMELQTELLQYSTEITALTALAAIPILFLMFQRDRKREQLRAEQQGTAFAEKRVPAWKYLLVVGVSIPFAIGLNNILMLSNITELSRTYQESAQILYAPPFPIQIICVGIIIPIMEELIFRGLIYKRVREDAPMKYAMIYSAAFFGLYHGNLVQIIYGTLSGLLLAYLYEKFDSLAAPLLAHMAMNVVVCMVTEIGGFNWLFQQPMRMGLITVVCAAVASSMFVLVREKVK